MDNGQRVRDFGVPSPKWDILIKLLTQGLRDIRKKRGGKIVRARPQTRHITEGRGECQTNQLHSAAILALAQGDHPHPLHPQGPGSMILPANPHHSLLYL